MRLPILLFLTLQILCTSCDRRAPVDYKFEELSEGWYFVVYNQEGEKELESFRGRVQLEFSPEKRLILTSSPPDFGSAKDQYFLKGEQVKKYQLGTPSTFHYEEKANGRTSMEAKFIYIGETKNMSKHGEAEQVLAELLEEHRAQSTKR